MYYLKCVSSTTALPIPSRLCDHEHFTSLTGGELASRFLLAIQLCPDVLIAAHVFIVDSSGTVCTGSSNRFFKITDLEVAALANSEAVIAR
jgi:hypothetical protein